MICFIAAVSLRASKAYLETARHLGIYNVPIPTWRFIRPDIDGGQKPSLDDRQWQTVSPGFSWPGENTKVWFCTKIVVPKTVGGASVEGCPIRPDLGMDDDGELYIDGELKSSPALSAATHRASSASSFCSLRVWLMVPCGLPEIAC
jgi:hypothetical protein